jgi:hypothetical protein
VGVGLVGGRRCRDNMGKWRDLMGEGNDGVV